jgi:hypothetical protein
MRKTLLLLLILFLSVCMGNIAHSQTNSKQSMAMLSMAKKIVRAAEYNHELASFYSSCKRISYVDAIKRIDAFPHNLENAKDFILLVFINYGKDAGYLTLRDFGFNQSELAISENIYAEWKEKQQKASFESQWKKYNEWVKNGAPYLNADEVTTPVKMVLNIETLAQRIDSCMPIRKAPIDNEFNVKVDANGNVVNFLDVLGNPVSKFLYNNADLQASMGKSALYEFEDIGKTVNVPSNVSISFKEKRTNTIEHNMQILIKAIKDKKTGEWIFEKNNFYEVEAYEDNSGYYSESIRKANIDSDVFRLIVENLGKTSKITEIKSRKCTIVLSVLKCTLHCYQDVADGKDSDNGYEIGECDLKPLVDILYIGY